MSAITQVILLAAGRVHRTNPDCLARLSKSGLYLSAVSNRLAASSPRSRFLGMIVGMGISRLVDPLDKAMKFNLEELESEEVKWYLNLINVNDNVGSLQDLKVPALPQSKKSERQLVTPVDRRVHNKKATHEGATSSKIISIEEVQDETESDEGDLIPYEKPDDDASDSEDDPTLVQLSKPTAPV